MNECQELSYLVLSFSAGWISWLCFLMLLCARKRCALKFIGERGLHPLQTSMRWLTMLQRAQRQKGSLLGGRWDEQMACCGGHQVQNNKRHLQFMAKTIKFYSLLNVALKKKKQTPKTSSVVLNFGNWIEASTEMAISCTGLVMYINFLADVMRHIVVMQGHSGHRKLCQSEVITCILSCPGGIAKIWLHQPRL